MVNWDMMSKINEARIGFVEFKFFIYRPDIFEEDENEYYQALEQLFKALRTINRIHNKHKEKLKQINTDLKKIGG